MNKKRILTTVVLASMILGSIGLTGCGNTKDTEQTTEEATVEEGQTTETQQSGECTVTLYDGDGTTVLDTVTVTTGEKAELTDPEKDGYTFMGWFVNPEKTRKFDAETAIEEDTDLYAGFSQYQEDTREFYIVGSGESTVLSESNWGAVIGDAQKLTKEENSEANVYTITLDLNEGDEFQFAIDGNWADQRGYGYMVSTEQDGTAYFKNSGSLGDASSKKSNINVAVSGNYTFTLTTYPADDIYDTEDEYYTEDTKENFNLNPYDTITFTYNGQ